MLYTTYFARLKTLPPTITPISICGKAPEWFTGIQYKKLAPKWGFFQEWKKTRDNHFYVECFNKQVLSSLDAVQVYNELASLAKTNDIALVCYEKPEDFCHRHLVAGWFRENGFAIKEWEIPATKAQPNKPLTIEELRQMNGQPVWCEEINEWGIVKIETIGRWANKIFLIGHYGNEQVRTNFEYDVEMRGLELYRHKPTEGAKKS